MSLLSYSELVELVVSGVITAPLENINGASIDITLDNIIHIESDPRFNAIVCLMSKENIETHEFIMKDAGYQLMPGEFILGASREIFNLHDNIVAEYVLKSSLARNGLNHMLAGYCDPTWHSSKLTLELKNETRNHYLTIKPGMKIGQMKFFRVNSVPEKQSYSVRGQYNNQSVVTPSKGVR